MFKGPGEALRRVQGFGEARWMTECRRQRGAQKDESVDVVESLTGGLTRWMGKIERVGALAAKEFQVGPMK